MIEVFEKRFQNYLSDEFIIEIEYRNLIIHFKMITNYLIKITIKVHTIRNNQ